MKKYTIELNERQLKLLSWACEKVSRIQMCQFDTVADIVSPPNHNFAFALESLKIFFGLDTGSYYSILSSEKVDDSARTMFDIHQVIRNYLAYEANPGVTQENRWKKGKYTVDFDEPMHADKENDLIKVKKI